MYIRRFRVNYWFIGALLVSLLLWRVLYRAIVIVLFLSGLTGCGAVQVGTQPQQGVMWFESTSKPAVIRFDPCEFTLVYSEDLTRCPGRV